ncbi:DNA repair protein RecO [Fusibacter ferrireducens]|uniref:DNA repair protein RecO n=1 Tax=Fusibacter ferrireducens TaxID=2785058 RepID=A0ABR9ZX42_9FIRM|nr:DNA repair protein RecO [Fusibacter ferrireducens]MBF4694926.1 DNA repair protein RecO [Fusibacter ferrireducens]
MFLETDGIVLKATKSTNNDVFLTVFTRKAGKIEVVANGAKSSKSPLAACSKPFVFGLFMINTSSKIMRLNNCTIHNSNFRITESLEKLAYGSYILELCHLSTPKNLIDLDHYMLVVEIVDLLAKKEVDLRLLQLSYLIKLAKFSGHMPNLTATCAQCGKPLDEFIFAINAGGLIHRHCIDETDQIFKINQQFMQIVQYLSVKDIRVIVNTKFHQRYIDHLLPMFELYISVHLDIRHINSKSFIETLSK